MNLFKGKIRLSSIISGLGIVWVCLMMIHGAICLAGDGIEPSAPLPDDITTLTIEQIMGMDVEVTTVTKQTKNIMETPSSVFVITGEDIRRSGATTLSDLLCLVPGFNVSQLNSQAFQNSKNNYGKYAQGFHGPVSTSLLILKDGMPILSQVTSVNWSQIDVVLEDVERIEVIRGAASSLWGSTAVNGVVNIITKPSSETKGVLLSGGLESNDGGSAVVQYGGGVSDETHYRLYTKYFEDRFELDDMDLNSSFKFDVIRSGFRLDQKYGVKDSLMCMGEVYSGAFDFRSFQNSFIRSLGKYDIDTESLGGNVFCRYTHSLSKRSDMVIRLYYDRMDNDFTTTEIERETEKKVDIGYGFTEEIVNLDFQHEYRWNKHKSIVWGIETRSYCDDFQGTYYMHATPEEKRSGFVSSFVQIDFPLATDYLFMTLGSNVSHNEYTGWDFQPSAQLLFRPDPRQTFWLSATRSVRTPSRLETGMYLGLTVARLPGRYWVYRFYGNEDIDPEELVSTEFGYRFKPSDTFFLDLSLYRNRYDDIIYFEPGDPIEQPSVDYPGETEYETPFYLTNQLQAESYGGELAVEWRLIKWLRLKAYYAYVTLDLDLSKMDAFFQTNYQIKKEEPKQEICFQSFYDVTDWMEINTRCRYMGELPKNHENSDFVLDTQMRFKVRKGLDLFLFGKNLTGSDVRYVSRDYFEAPTVTDTSVCVKLEWRY